MSKDKIVEHKAADEKPTAPESPAGDVQLSDEDLGSVAGGAEEAVVDSLSCTGDNTYCKGTCCIPWLTLGCCT